MNSPGDAELLVVLPVFNEESSIRGVITEWTQAFERSGCRFVILILDDGSTDRTPDIIENVRSLDPERVLIQRHENRGHGQTCLAGYSAACKLGVPWVFQIDSDGQCAPEFFHDLWALRASCDVAYGRRAVREDGPRRALASTLLRVMTWVATGCWCVDPNVPYRLMRTQQLAQVLATIPTTFFLANVALAVQLRRANWREGCVPIRFRQRTGGEPKVPITTFGIKALELLRDFRSLPV